MMSRWIHKGPLHWFTACWHSVDDPEAPPGHCRPRGWSISHVLDRCCVCGRVRLYGNGMMH